MVGRRLVGLVTLAIVIGAVVIVAHLYIAARDDLLSGADENLREVARDAAQEATDLFEPAQLVIRQVVDAGLERDNPANAERRFSSISRTVMSLAPQITGLTLARSNGSVLLIQNLPPRKLIESQIIPEDYKGFVRRVVNWGGEKGDAWSYWDPVSREWAVTQVAPDTYDARVRPWYIKALQHGQPVWSEPYVFAASGAAGITLAMPVRDGTGTVWGVVGVDFALSRLSSLVFDYRRRAIGNDGFMFIGNEEGGMLAHSGLLPALKGLREESSEAIARASSIQNTHRENGDDLALFKAIRTDGQVYRAHNGNRDVIGIRLPLDAEVLAAYVYIGEPVDGIVGQALAELRRNVLILIVLSGVLLMVAFYAVKLRREVHERKQAQAALSLARDSAEAATRAKSAFLAIMSHEIRTPMNGVMSMVEILNQTELNKDQRDMTTVIRQSSQALLSIIDDVLDFSKIEAGKLDLERIAFDLTDAVESIGDLLAPRFEEKGLTLLLDVSPNTPTSLIGDPNRVRQILMNLCGNALKFTNRGFVHVILGGQKEGNIWHARVDVVDTGIGLDPQQRAKLFQPFVQADTSTSRKFGGTGLGLSICQRLCELMNGSIGVVSSQGSGSTFWFEVPFSIGDPRPHTPAVSIDAARVLLVQYDTREAEIITRYLREGGVASIQRAAAADGGDLRMALDRVEAPVDLVIVNARHGAQQLRKTLAALRRHDATRGSRDVLAAPLLAASILRADASSIADAQWLATLTTPIRQHRLWDVVGAALGKMDLARAETTTGSTATFAPPKLETAAAAQAVVLVAEDNATNRKVIGRLLERLGYALEFAENGSEALSAWESAPARYGMLLTDFHMPIMDGFELTHAIRCREDALDRPRLPIIALTADVSPETERHCLDAAMNGYLRKPIEQAALIAALERWLPQALPLRQRKEGRSAKSSPRPGPVDHAIITAQLGTTDMAEHIDLLQSFWENCRNAPEELTSTFNQEDAKAVRALAHSLKGATAMIGARELSEALNQIELAAIEGDLVPVIAQLDNIRSGFAEIRLYLDHLVQAS